MNNLNSKTSTGEMGHPSSNSTHTGTKLGKKMKNSANRGKENPSKMSEKKLMKKDLKRHTKDVTELGMQPTDTATSK